MIDIVPERLRQMSRTELADDAGPLVRIEGGRAILWAGSS